MTSRRIIWAAIIGCALCAATAIAQTPQKAGSGKELPAVPSTSKQPSAPPPVQQQVEVQALLDRTAVWVGDRVTYTIELKCQPGVDILADDLSPDKLKLDGFEVLGNDTDRNVGPGDATTYRFRYYLTTYSVDATTLKIGAMGVRYYVKRPGQRIEDSTEAGEVQLPALVAAVRSLLADDQKTYSVRDARPAAVRPLRYAMLQSVGIGLVVISIAPALLFASMLVRRIRQRGAVRSPRQVREGEQTSLETLRSMDIATPEGRCKVYARLNSLVRDHLRDVCGVQASNLTSAEIGPALSERGARPSAELVTSVLTACEQALYAPVDLLPSAEACRQTMKHAEEVLASGP